jgi:VWFA-related protein
MRTRGPGCIGRSLWILLLCPSLAGQASAHSSPQSSQQSSQQVSANSPPYAFKLPANEISLTFAVFGADGGPLTHLEPTDLRLWDDGKRQQRILMLESYSDLPIHAGFIIDVSASMQQNLHANQAILQTYTSRFFREGIDRAFVMKFDEEALITQDWTDKAARVAAGAAGGGLGANHLPLTSIFDALYIACRDQWLAGQDAVTGNFILLFSDGLDNDSHAYLSEAVDMCQRSRTAIYAITNSGRSPFFSAGQNTLEELARTTGGRVFFNPQGYWLLKDFQLMEAEQRNQFHLVYKPSDFSTNGHFHRITLHCAIRGAKVVTRSGYYAFAQP